LIQSIIAGGSSRFMFSRNTEQVIEIIKDSVSRVGGDIVEYIKGTMGEQSEIINHLLNIFYVNGEYKIFLLSKYVGSRIANKLGPKVIENFYDAIKRYTNPSMDGWVLEMWFFASLVHNGITLSNTSGKTTLFERSEVFDFDPENPSYNVFKDGPKWMKPLKWNQGGYDGVYVDLPNELVRFIQITRGAEHSFKLEYFHKLLKAFSNKFDTSKGETYKITKVEIYFLLLKKIFWVLKYHILK